jgi:hypothetical protein
MDAAFTRCVTPRKFHGGAVSESFSIPHVRLEARFDDEDEDDDEDEELGRPPAANPQSAIRNGPHCTMDFPEDW